MAKRSSMALFPATELPVNTTAVVGEITDAALKRTLLSMGVTEGQDLIIFQKTLFQTSFYVSINRHTLALRKQEMACLLVELKSGADDR
jgi:Fe2+ transport system protein FeoA